jgi:hypothetical protein
MNQDSASQGNFDVNVFAYNKAAKYMPRHGWTDSGNEGSAR